MARHADPAVAGKLLQETIPLAIKACGSPVTLLHSDNSSGWIASRHVSRDPYSGPWDYAQDPPSGRILSARHLRAPRTRRRPPVRSKSLPLVAIC